MIDNKQLKQWREIAEAATDGPWDYSEMPSHGDFVVSETNAGRGVRYRIARIGQHHGSHRERNMHDATHIATFDPPTALVLLDEIERLRNALDTIESMATIENEECVKVARVALWGT